MASRSLLTNLDCTGQQLTGSPTIITPTVASFANATHSHTNSAGGGTLAEAALALTDITTNDVSTTKHGFTPKAPNDTTKFLRGDATWAAPSGMTLLTTVTASASATVDFTANINSTYKTYWLFIDNLCPVTDNVSLRARISTAASGFLSDALYKWDLEEWAGSVGLFYEAATSSTYIQATEGTSNIHSLGNDTDESSTWLFTISNPSGSGKKCIIRFEGAYITAGTNTTTYWASQVFGMGYHNTAGAINGIRFYMSAGNISTGTFRLYGIP